MVDETTVYITIGGIHLEVKYDELLESLVYNDISKVHPVQMFVPEIELVKHPEKVFNIFDIDQRPPKQIQ